MGSTFVCINRIKSIKPAIIWDSSEQLILQLSVTSTHPGKDTMGVYIYHYHSFIVQNTANAEYFALKWSLTLQFTACPSCKLEVIKWYNWVGWGCWRRCHGMVHDYEIVLMHGMFLISAMPLSSLHPPIGVFSWMWFHSHSYPCQKQGLWDEMRVDGVVLASGQVDSPSCGMEGTREQIVTTEQMFMLKSQILVGKKQPTWNIWV